MRLTATVTESKNKYVEIEEHFSHQDNIPCIDFVVDGYLVARQGIHKQLVGEAFRIINKLYVLPEPVLYDGADKVDVPDIAPAVEPFSSYVGWVVPDEKSKKATKNSD